MKALRKNFQVKQSKFEQFCASRKKECEVRAQALRYVPFAGEINNYRKEKTQIKRCVCKIMFTVFAKGRIPSQLATHCQKGRMQLNF
jgi:hypothetical protein